MRFALVQRVFELAACANAISAALIPSGASATPAPLSASTLSRRAAKSCTLTSQCSQAIPANSHRLCASKLCSYSCNTGYKASGASCIKVATTTTKKSTNPSKKAVSSTKSSSKTTSTSSKKTTTTSKPASKTSLRTTTTTKKSVATTKATSTTSKTTSKATTTTKVVATTTSADRITSTSTSSTSSASATPSPAVPAVPSLTKTYSGATFFDDWEFEAIEDPTRGMVRYVNRTEAQSLGLVSVDNGVAKLSIDRNSTLASGAYRDSVRIKSNAYLNVGTLVTIDMPHVPWGCSVWPAFWLLGPNWPTQGEIDVYEGVSSRTFGTYTLHSSAGCVRDTSLPFTGSATGTQTQCDVAVNYNTGCGIVDSEPSSYGAGWNSAGGSVIALAIETSGISIWRWKRSNLPADITLGGPRPETWGTPIAQWGNSTCNTSSYFRDLQMVFDITTCGDWAGAQHVWQSTRESGNCYSSRYPTCASAVANPANFAEAYFAVNSINLYAI